MGSKSSPSVPVCSHCPDAVPIDSSVHKVFFECGLPCLCWPTSFPATSTRSPWHSTIGWSSRWHPDDVACHPKPPLCYNVYTARAKMPFVGSIYCICFVLHLTAKGRWACNSNADNWACSTRWQLFPNTNWQDGCAEGSRPLSVSRLPLYTEWDFYRVVNVWWTRLRVFWYVTKCVFDFFASRHFLNIYVSYAGQYIFVVFV